MLPGFFFAAEPFSLQKCDIYVTKQCAEERCTTSD
jgi:hypothetical protein